MVPILEFSRLTETLSMGNKVVMSFMVPFIVLDWEKESNGTNKKRNVTFFMMFEFDVTDSFFRKPFQNC